MVPVVVTLTGYLKSVEGMFVSYCNELYITTSAATPDEAIRRTREMIKGYFVAAKKLGTYEATIARLTGIASSPPSVKIEFRLKQGDDLPIEVTV